MTEVKYAMLSPRKWGGETWSDALRAVADALETRPLDEPAVIVLRREPTQYAAVVYWIGRMTEQMQCDHLGGRVILGGSLTGQQVVCASCDAVLSSTPSHRGED
jgi:hypothetical protein